MQHQPAVGFCVLLALILLTTVRAHVDFAELCRLFKNGTQMRKPGTCNEYITCSGGKGEYKACSVPRVYEPSKQSCIEAASSSNKAYCSNQCEGLHGKWLSNPTNCKDYFYCYNGSPLSGSCEGDMHFDEMKQMCVYEVNSDCIGVAKICQTLPDKTTFRNEKDCSTYYECKNGMHSLKKCSGATYYDVNSGKCIDKTLVPCNAHPNSGICKSSTKIFKGLRSDQATCRGYFLCKDLGIVEDIDPMWGQCPEGTFFLETSQKCSEPTSVVCKYNRCEGRGTMLVTTSTDDCHSYTVCKDGYPVETKRCHNDMFFDEKTQACTTRIIYDKCCDGQK